MVELVQTMLDLNRQLHSPGSDAPGNDAPGSDASPGSPTPQPLAAPQRRALEGQLAATDRQIDQLVYDLYNLIPEEIALVEQSTAPGTPGS